MIIIQFILSELIGKNISANIVFNGSSLFDDFGFFCKDFNFIMINYKFTIHDTLHFAFLYFEWMYKMMSIHIKKPLKLPSMVSIFTSRTAGRGSSQSFLHTVLNTCINISPYFGLRFYWRTVWLHILIMLTCQIFMLTCQIFMSSCQIFTLICQISLIHLLENKS